MMCMFKLSVWLQMRRGGNKVGSKLSQCMRNSASTATWWLKAAGENEETKGSSLPPVYVTTVKLGFHVSEPTYSRNL